MKGRYRAYRKVLLLLLVLSIFMVGFAVSLPSAAVIAQTTPDPGLDQYGGWKGLQGTNTTGHWTVELIGDRYWFVTPENNVLWVLGHQHCTPGPVWQDSPALGYAPTSLVNAAKYSSTEAWANKQLERSQEWGFNSTLFMDWGAPNAPNITRFALLDVKYLALDASAAVRVDDYFVDVFDARYAAECAKRAEVVLRPLVDDPWTIGVYLGNEQSWNGTGGHQIGLPNMFIELPPTAAGKQYWVNTFLKTRYPTVKNLNDAYGTLFYSWDDVLQCTGIADSTTYPQTRKDKVDFSEDIAEAYYKPLAAAVRAVTPRLLLLSDRLLPLGIVEYLDYNERIWKVAGKYCEVFCINSYVNYATLERTDRIISRMSEASGRPILITEHSYTANDTSLPLHSGWVGGFRVASQTDRASSYVDYLNGLLPMKVQGPAGQSVNPFLGIVWHKWYDDPALGTGSAGGERYNFGLLDGLDEAYTPLTDVMKTAHSQIYEAITHSKPIAILSAPSPLAPVNGYTMRDGATFSWQSVQRAVSYTLLISPEKAFPDEQTIRVDGIKGTSWTSPSPLASGHFWWTVRANEEDPEFGGYYAQASEFRIENSAGRLNTGLSLDQLNRVTFEDIWDAGGAASSYAFLDTTQKSEGNSSARCVFTRWAWNKTGAIGRNDASVFIDTPGATERWTGLTLSVRPTSFYDTTGKFVPSSSQPTALIWDCYAAGKLVPSSKYLRMRAWDERGKLFLEWPLDPEGKLPIGQWSTVTIPFGAIGPQNVSKIAVTFVTEQDKLATDQRLTINLDNIVPLTTAVDDTAPSNPLITDLTLSADSFSLNLDATDPESGIREAQVCIGRTPGASDLLPWTTLASDLFVSLPFTPAGSSPWYVSAKAQNGAGSWSAVTTIDGSAWTSSTRAHSIAAEHGSISPAGTVLIPSGGTQVFSVVPTFGYVVQDILVDGISVGAPSTVTIHGDGPTHTVIARFAFSESAWSLDRLPAQARTVISMPVGSTSYRKNGLAMTLDVPPFIRSGRTLVPVRAISEGLGAEVQWDAATRTVTLSLDGFTGTRVVKMTIGAMAYTIDGRHAWMDVAPAIVSGRTFVPLRAVSEALGAQVDWNADTRTVLIQGLDVNSTPPTTSKTLKELYAAAKTWDTNGNGIADSLELFFTRETAIQPALERILKRTEIFARADDTVSAATLPSLSIVTPVGTRGSLTKVQYRGHLTGYIPTNALETSTRDLPSVKDTEKWVTASGPSLQSFLGDAVKTQWLGYLKPGQSIAVLGDAVTATGTGSEAFGFETWKMVDVPVGTPNGAFGIQFRITRTMSLTADPLDTGSDIFDEPCLYFMGHVNDGNGEWWDGTSRVLMDLQRRWALDGDKDQNHLVSGDPVLRSGQLYEIRFPDGTGNTALITLPDGTVIDTIDMTGLVWNDRGGCFPDRKFFLGMWISPRSSITISDLAFIVPPPAP
jgi:hypothetical protein